MWRKHPNFDETGITLIRSLWPNEVPPHLDAVYQNVQRNVILFFKGKVNELKSNKLKVMMLLNDIHLKVIAMKSSVIYCYVVYFFSRPAVLGAEAVRS